MLQAALTYAHEHRARFLEEYKALLALPSISTLPENREAVHKTALWLADELKRLGLDAVELVETTRHPVVYAESLRAPGKPTVLVYGHYDVQPVDPLDEWDSDPFGGEIRGDYIFARGASDMKGQIFAQLKAIEAMTAQGALPLNLKYVLEGEEEIGSPNLPAFLDAWHNRLGCDILLNCDAGIEAPDTPSITYALRGLAYFEIELQTATKDLHSGMFGGTVLNPIHVLCDLIAGMHDADGRVTLPGFYDAVRELDPEERAQLARAPYSDAEWRSRAGVTTLCGEAGYTTIERVGARPTIEVNGVWGGFTGEGAKTVLPARASAKISTRLVADQQPESIQAMLRAYLEAHMPEGVEWRLIQHSCGPGAIMDRHSSYMKAAVDALREEFGAEPIFTREGGSVPIVGMLQQRLGVDSVMLGFALPDDGIHSPNERQYLPNFYKGIDTYIRFMLALGQ
jgi:acetylornithine deacetylase/succinyl-diaminopimelate desuccinylase-like protein